MKKNRVKERLRSGKPSIGLLVTTGHPDLAEIYAKCGFDWLFLDTEHGNIGRETLHSMIQAMEATDCVPFVRVLCNDPAQIKVPLDMGALGIIVPQVNTKEEAIRAVHSCKYGPEGIRGCSPRRASDYYLRLHEYIEIANEQVMVIPQIESLQAVKNIDEILSVKGIDAISIGSWDMSSSMSMDYLRFLGTDEFPHPQVSEAIRNVVDACRKVHLPVIMGAANAEGANRLIGEGHKLILLGEDIDLYQTYIKELSRIKR
jgi:2-keto-3-deoxy-L-rhamnonate aldolase RhmA